MTPTLRDVALFALVTAPPVAFILLGALGFWEPITN
jgi:hypothetical protein